jgi:antitoxin VapB
MNIVLNIPDDVAAILGKDVERQALEALALDSYRAGRLAKAELRRMLGFATRADVDRFLLARDVSELSAPETRSKRRMTVDQMLSLGADIAAMPLLDPRSPREIMDDLNVI